MNKSIAFVGLTLVVAIFAAQSIQLPYRPQVVGTDAPDDVFSAARAGAHLQVIAQRPHPVGSEEIRKVRRYLVEQITALGLDAEVQKTPYLARLNYRNYGVQVENVLTRIPGREPGPAVLFVAHYDSAPQGPGAADNGSAVASLLEMLRAITTGPRLKNDLMVLFSDAEEPGVLGAQAFHDLHPWMEDVRLVVNLEARGYRGPVIMFETGPGNARWLRELRATGVPVVAASFTSEIYARMSNETDFTVFRESRIGGLNFAFIHDAVRYHTALASIENLDRRSLQQQGEISLALARRLGDTDLEAPASSNAVYFNLLGALISFPVIVARILWVLVILASLALLIQAFRGGNLSPDRTTAATLILLLAPIVVGVLLLGISLVATPRSNFALASGMSSFQLVQLGLTLLGVGLTILVYRLLRRWFEVTHLVVAGIILWLLLAGAMGALAIAASYLFVLPLAAALPAAALILRQTGDSDADSPAVSPLLLAALALPAVLTALLWTSPLVLIGLAIGPVNSSMLVGIVLTLLLIGLLAPALGLADGSRWAWVVALGAIVLAIAAFSRAPGSYSESNRRLASLFYSLDQETGKAHWYSLLPLNSWTRKYLGETPEELQMPPFLGVGLSGRRVPAPAAPLEGPRVRLHDVAAADGVQTWQVEINWPPEVTWFHLFVEPRDQVKAVTLPQPAYQGDQRREIAGGRRPHIPTLTWFAPPEGLTLGIEMEGDAPIELELVGLRSGLPEIPGFVGEPMPADMMMARFSYVHVSTSTRGVVKLTRDDVVQPEADEETEETEAEAPVVGVAAAGLTG